MTGIYERGGGLDITLEQDYSYSVSAHLNDPSPDDPAPGDYMEFYWNARVQDAMAYLSKLHPQDVVHVILKSSQVKA